MLGAPRSGTSILQRALAQHDSLWGPYGESHRILEGPLKPRTELGESNQVTDAAIQSGLIMALDDAFWRHAVSIPRMFPDLDTQLAHRSIGVRLRQRARAAAWNRLGAGRRRPPSIALIEKTPKNCLRVPLLHALVPDARYVLLIRGASETVDSIMEGWRAYEQVGPWRRKRFATYRVARSLGLRDWDGDWWCFTLIPGWRELAGATLAEVAIAQYEVSLRMALEDLMRIAPGRWMAVRYDQLVERPAQTLRAVLAWSGFAASARVEAFAERAIRRSPRPIPRNAAALAPHQARFEVLDREFGVLAGSAA